MRPALLVWMVAGLLGGAGFAQAEPKSPEKAARWAEKMGLTEAQAEKLKAAFGERRKTVKPLKRRLRDAMLGLRDQVEDDAGDAAIQAGLDKVAKAREALRAEQEKFDSTLASILPPKQRALLLIGKGRALMGGMGRPRMMHRGARERMERRGGRMKEEPEERPGGDRVEDEENDEEEDD